MVILLAMGLSLVGASAYAQATNRERALEERVEYLERRLERLEGALGRTPHRAASRVPARTVVAQPASPPEVSDGITRRPSLPEAAAAPAAVANERAENAPQELNVLRENSVTLKPKGFEVSQELNYTSRRSALQRDQGFIANTSIRYGLLDWLELSTTIPYGYTYRTTNLGPVQSVRQTLSGFGDVVVQANARVLDQTASLPGVVVSLGVIAPTGDNPYIFRNYRLDAPGFIPTPNPGNPLAYYYSRSAWGVRSNLEVFKTVDPLIVFAGFGVDYTRPQKFSGFTIDPGLRYNYNLGLSFALSEKTTLGFSVIGSYSQDLRVNGRKVFDSSQNPALARLVLIQRVIRNVYLEPSVSFGMNQDGPDFALGLGARARF